MNHRPITEDDLHAYVDRVLEPERQAEVAAYLGEHPDVARRVAAFTDQRDLLRAALAPIAEEPAAGGAQSVAHHREPRATAFAGPVGDGGNAVVEHRRYGRLGRARRAAGCRRADWLRSLRRRLFRIASTHRTAFDPSRFARPTGPNSCNGSPDRLHRPVKVPDLATSGYRLMGGRLVATSHGPAAMFMYDDDRGSRIVVLTRPMSSADQNAPMTPQSQGDVGGFAWADDGVGYSLVGRSGILEADRK